MTQTDLAARLGLAPSTVSRWESKGGLSAEQYFAALAALVATKPQMKDAS